MNRVDAEYQALVRRILTEGVERPDRTGTGTKAVIGAELRIDLQSGFPLLLSKRVPFSLIVSETLMFLKGRTDLRFLLERKNTIWNEWCFKKWVESEEYKGPDMKDFGLRVERDEAFRALYQREMTSFEQRILTDESFSALYGDLGRIYGAQWRNAFAVCPDTLNVEKWDPLKEVISEIEHNPTSRRLVVSSWNPDNHRGNHSVLPCCHHQFQFIIQENRLSLIFDMRSSDVFLGLPFNLAGYALLCHLVARETGYEVGNLIYHGKDVHLYLNHFSQASELLSRKPEGGLPSLAISSDKSMFDLDVGDILLQGYHPLPTIKAPVAV